MYGDQAAYGGDPYADGGQYQYDDPNATQNHDQGSYDQNGGYDQNQGYDPNQGYYENQDQGYDPNAQQGYYDDQQYNGQPPHNGLEQPGDQSLPYYPPEYDNQPLDANPNMRKSQFSHVDEPRKTGRNIKEKKEPERINPDQIPRPVEAVSGTPLTKYHTRSGTLPPPSTSEFFVVDEGNCSPRFIRMTTNHIANDAELLESTKLCVGAIIQPLANLAPDEEPVALVDHGDAPIRCSRCRAYVNPFFQFVDGGKFFICNLCEQRTEVPMNYRCNLDPNGARRDRDQRPELSRGTVEFVAGKDFLLRPIQNPVYLFVLDVSYAAAVSGLVGSAVQAIRTAVDALAYNPRVRIGIITYDHSIQFYSAKSGRTDPSMTIATDVDSPFVPLPPSDLFVDPSIPEKRELLEKILNLILQLFETPKSTPTADTTRLAVGAVAQVAADALEVVGGKVLLVLSGLPTHGVGKLEYRDKGNLYGTAKEKTLFLPQNNFYATVSSKCAECAVTFDLFVCANSYVDLPTIGALANRTGGQIFSYPGFNGRKDGVALYYDMYHNCTRNTGYDAVMVVRTSTGLRVAEYFGNYYHRRATEMDLPTIDCDKAFGIRLEHEGKLKGKEACVQCALLYTNSAGERRIRVHTLSLPITPTMPNIFRYADLDSIINLSLKQAVRQLMSTTTCEEAQAALTQACVESLFVYRKSCASATSAGQLILPEPLKLLPLYTLGLCKNPLLQPGLNADERSFLFSTVTSMASHVSAAFVCPRLFSLTNIPEDCCVPRETGEGAGRVYLPPNLTLSIQSIEPDGLYILDNSSFLYLWIGEELSAQVTMELFGIDRSDNAPSHHYVLQQSEDPTSLAARVQLLVNSLRQGKASYQNLQIIPRQRDKLAAETLDEKAFFSHLIEDGDKKKEDTKKERGASAMSYVDFLCWLHKRIQQKFSQL